METMQPKVRFPKFKGNWEKKKLIDISDLITKGTTPKNFSEKGINFLKIECLDGHIINTNKCVYVDEITHNKELKRSILKENDILFAIAGATIGKCTIVTKSALPANTNQAFSIIRLKENENINYIFQILKSDRMSKYINDNISVGAQPNLNLEQMGSFSFYCPTVNEQIEIANFLTSIDEKINLLKEKKSLLEDYKKGIMQQIFSQKVRFKDENSNDFDDWEEIELGEILDYIQPTKYIVKLTNYDNSFETPVLTAGKTFILGYTDETDNVFSNKLPVIIFDDFTTANKYVDFPFKVKSSAMKILVKKKNNNVDIKYIYEFMQTLNFSSGDEHKRYWISEYSKCIIQLPQLEEQIKISNFLSAIDEKIDLVNVQILETQEYKKGLLQQMFI